ncbi:unnamed protein product [Nyctereutes procyonoides]|uniref:(raccoon dog) hypothetical protein n=1 Tax=Nyctereutes procyonoides TaxID=34880 RepID=A0A811Z4K8_NYCPR|nr:zinc finger BED domain-containing protein 3 [Nyctereutes procyonoides]XP_055198255.1 zinc finger BED domain-containing protein 3 [Nyctereutes procyonoides]XP_055198256.1 zinc finger BED domain-containing protein 3 [Nyctereutes procyonoides]XP_055198258.1 zinc finger BED domain-containing protein 3 [Nyctereutes procyonoides]XP_055198259.1 zinc finger BED domain-containing protein 3 [Nyctereutes procyonoides]XP_055198260.1 zinc finger BED domain-containing protein 3 [Nyctereutes procyonoides]
MRTDELPAAPMDTPGPGRRGAPSCEAWGYFHLAAARPGRAAGQWATCRLCGEQVSPGFHAGAAALWRHLEGAHRPELQKSAARPPPPPPGPPAAAEGDWARLLEQMGALAERCRVRERELARREAAVGRAQRALERRRRALQQEERAAAQERRQLRADAEALRARLRDLGRREAALAAAPGPPPPKGEPGGHADGSPGAGVLLL